MYFLSVQILILVAWYCMTMVGFVVTGAIEDDNLHKGNPALLTNPMDYRGRICGVSSGVKDKSVGYYMPDASGSF